MDIIVFVHDTTQYSQLTFESFVWLLNIYWRYSLDADRFADLNFQ